MMQIVLAAFAPLSLILWRRQDRCRISLGIEITLNGTDDVQMDKRSPDIDTNERNVNYDKFACALMHLDKLLKAKCACHNSLYFDVYREKTAISVFPDPAFVFLLASPDETCHFVRMTL